MQEKLISVDFQAQFGFLKRPDINEGIYMTYNCLHKPALLGILGSIVGLGGLYQAYAQNKKQRPEYYQMLMHIKVGVRPLGAVNGHFQKIVVNYTNTVGYANLDEGILQVSEQTLVKPTFRVYLLLDIQKALEQKLYQCLKNKESVFIPYLGKNDFQLWWENFREYQFEVFRYDSEFEVETLFMKTEVLKDSKKNDLRSRIDPTRPAVSFFMYFENHPHGYDEHTSNYELKTFVFTNFKFPAGFRGIQNLLRVKDENKIIQLY